MLEPTRQSARRSHPTYRLRSEALQILGYGGLRTSGGQRTRLIARSWSMFRNTAR